MRILAVRQRCARVRKRDAKSRTNKSRSIQDVTPFSRVSFQSRTSWLIWRRSFHNFWHSIINIFVTELLTKIFYRFIRKLTNSVVLWNHLSLKPDSKLTSFCPSFFVKMATYNVSLLLELIREKLLIFISIKKFKNYIAALTIEFKKNKIPDYHHKINEWKKLRYPVYTNSETCLKYLELIEIPQPMLLAQMSPLSSDTFGAVYQRKWNNRIILCIRKESFWLLSIVASSI